MYIDTNTIIELAAIFTVIFAILPLVSKTEQTRRRNTSFQEAAYIQAEYNYHVRFGTAGRDKSRVCARHENVCG